MSPVTASPIQTGNAGNWSITVTKPGYPPTDVTVIRGVPTSIDAISFSDPGGPKAAQLTFPSISILDTLGAGDLSWCIPDAWVDIVWNGPVLTGFPWNQLRWSGFMTSPSYSLGSSSALTFGCVGTLISGLDHYLAKPVYPSQPLTYEFAISRAVNMCRENLGIGPITTQWPSWWTNRYVPVKGRPLYQIPSGTPDNAFWTGMLTRSTGSWDPVFSSYIQSLLQGMYTSRGRFTIDLFNDRQPVLYHLDYLYAPDPALTVMIDPANPGVSGSLSSDYEQAANTYYGQGVAFSGVAFSGMVINNAGAVIGYAPLAQSRQVDGTSRWHDRYQLRRETNLQLQQGLDATQAKQVAQAQYSRFSNPGLSGNIVLAADPTDVYGTPIPRSTVRAGMSLMMPNIGGSSTGQIFHITDSSYSFSAGTNSLTVDTEYRDSLTVNEVINKGRDPMAIPRLLVAGGYSPPLPDQMMPWNYGEGSGYLPSTGEYSAVKLFDGMPADLQFPWTSWLNARPPKLRTWANCYMKIGPKSSNADNNWAVRSSRDALRMGYPFKMAQAGTIMLVQVVAVDLNGNPLKVPFHLSLYTDSGINVMAMPELIGSNPDDPTQDASHHPPYAIGQHYPFFASAFESYNPDGTIPEQGGTNAPSVASSGLVRAWGTYYTPAGYFPGDPTVPGSKPTGLLVDEAQWTFDLTQTGASTWDPYSISDNRKNPFAGMMYAMIYCDAQGNQDVYFVGRMYVLPPAGSSVGGG